MFLRVFSLSLWASLPPESLVFFLLRLNEGDRGKEESPSAPQPARFNVGEENLMKTDSSVLSRGTGSGGVGIFPSPRQHVAINYRGAFPAAQGKTDGVGSRSRHWRYPVTLKGPFKGDSGVGQSRGHPCLTGEAEGCREKAWLFTQHPTDLF